MIAHGETSAGAGRACGEASAGDAVHEALARSAIYQALALGFRRPTPQTVARLATPDGVAGLASAAMVLDAERVRAAIAALAGVERGLAPLTRAHERLFGHTARGVVPPYETEYGADDLFQQPQAMADAAGFYAAFGLVTAPAAAERPDHVSCECEFLMVLARREALACERADADGEAASELALVRRAAVSFLRDHLARFAPAFAAGLRHHDPGGFHGALGAVLDAHVAWECARLGVQPGAASLRLRSSADDGVPMACGGCALAPGGAEPDAGD